jgi:hypothetical protein
MEKPTAYPRIRSVKPTKGKELLVTFDNGDQRLYDCAPLLKHEAFSVLEDEAIFQCARPDPHGYAVIWNDDVDLAESEIWVNGKQPNNRRHVTR